MIDGLGGRFKTENLRTTEDGQFESVTLFAPDDFAAMDIICTAGDEVVEQLPTLIEELEPNMLDDEEKSQLDAIKNCSARLEVFRFEQHTFTAPEDGVDANVMDPGGVLIVLQRLNAICDGVVVDPQSSSVL